MEIERQLQEMREMEQLALSDLQHERDKGLLHREMFKQFMVSVDAPTVPLSSSLYPKHLTTTSNHFTVEAERPAQRQQQQERHKNVMSNNTNHSSGGYMMVQQQKHGLFNVPSAVPSMSPIHKTLLSLVQNIPIPDPPPFPSSTQTQQSQKTLSSSHTSIFPIHPNRLPINLEPLPPLLNATTLPFPTSSLSGGSSSAPPTLFSYPIPPFCTTVLEPQEHFPNGMMMPFQLQPPIQHM
jgi:hypothetical protein